MSFTSHIPFVVRKVQRKANENNCKLVSSHPSTPMPFRPKPNDSGSSSSGPFLAPLVYDPNAKSGVAAVARLEAKAAVVDGNIIDEAANGNNSKDVNENFIQTKVNRMESSTMPSGIVSDTKINEEQAIKASGALANGDLKEHVKHDVSNEQLNGDLKVSLEQDLKQDVNKPTAKLAIVKEEAKRPAVVV